MPKRDWNGTNFGAIDAVFNQPAVRSLPLLVSRSAFLDSVAVSSGPPGSDDRGGPPDRERQACGAVFASSVGGIRNASTRPYLGSAALKNRRDATHVPQGR
jgi:hypothetical protein